MTITATSDSVSGTAQVIVLQPPALGLDPASLTFNATQGGPNPTSQLTTIVNDGGETLSGLSVVAITYGAGASGWLQTPTLSGTTADPSVTLTVQPVTGSLAAGTYTATIPVQSALASNSPQNVTVTFIVTLPPAIDLNPGGLTFTAALSGANPASQLTTITNSGGGTLSGLSLGTITYGAGASGWLQTPSLSGTTANPSVILTVQPVTGSLAAGTYTAAIPVQSSVASNSPRDLTVTFNVTELPDFVLDAVIAPATGTIGGTISVLATLRNQGSAATGAFRLGLYLSTDATITTSDLFFGFCTYPTGLGANATSDCSGPITVPNTLPVGTYYVGAIADDQGQISEGNESNNARAAPTPIVVSPPGPDLVLDVVTAPPTGALGGTISVLATVRSQGGATTGAFRVGFYLSTDATITTSDVFFGSCTYSSGLGANATGDCTGPLSVPSVTPGTYYVGAIADDQGQITESNESNNARAASNPTVVSPPAPDFVLDVVTAPATGTIGGTIPVLATVRNQGAATTGAFRLGFYLSTNATITTSDVFFGFCTYPTGLGANATSDCSGPITVPSTLTPGTYYVGAIADDQAQIGESNESNNALAAANTTELTVASPDLVLTAVTAPATATIGSTASVSGTVQNQGSGAAAAFRLGFYLSADATITTADVFFGSCTYSSGLGVSGTADCSGSVTVPNALPPGTYYVGAIADDQAQISESNESNNARAASNPTVVSPPAPDFVLDAVTAPATGTVGSTISVLATVRNQGGATTGAFRLGFYLSANASVTTSDVFFGFCTYSSGLGANATSDCSGPLTVPNTLTPGTYFVGAIADDQAQISESDEGNNALAAASTTVLTVVPDLVLDVVTAPATGTIGSTIPVLATVRNQGGSTTGVFRLGFYLSTNATITTSDVFFGSCNYSSGLGANATSDCTGPLTVPSVTPGMYYVGAIADDQGQIIESNESNNALAAANPSVLTLVPDLVLDGVTAPATGAIGGTISVLATVRNQGGATTEAFRLGFYLSTNATISTSDVFFGFCTYTSGLGANATNVCSGPLTVPNTLTPGTYYVGAIADDQAQIGESNESNNALAAANTTVLTVAGPDLVLDLVTAPATGSLGGTISVLATVRNQGSVATGAFRLGFYLSTNTTITTSDVFFGFCTHAAGLAVNATNNCSGPVNVPTVAPGTYYVGAIADDQAQVSESNEGNNALASPTTTVISGGSGLNLTIDGMYLTQATQTYTGTVPLVAGRNAFLRVFARANQSNTAAPDVRVRFYQNGTLVDTRTLSPGSSSVPASITEGVLTSSWNLSVAGSVMQPGLSLLADVDPTNAIAEASETDNSFPSSGTAMALDVRTVSTFNVMFVPVVQTANGLQGDVTAANRDTYTDFANRVYPLSAIDVSVHAAFSFASAISSSYDATWTTLLNSLQAQRVVEGSTRQWYGVIRPAYSFGGTGMAILPLGSRVAIGVDWTTAVAGSNTTLRSMTFAHEMGHNFARRHVDCGNPGGPDPSYPYDPTSTGVYGYDLTRNQLLAPEVYADFMSYCTPLWISDYTYEAVLNYRAANPQSGPSGVSQSGVLVWGRIGPNGIVLEPSFEVEAPPSLPTRAGPYRVQATDNTGRELFNLSFEGEPIDHVPEERIFAFVVPLSATASRPAAVRLLANGRESLRRGSAPIVAAANATRVLASVRLTRLTGPGSRLEWDAAAYPMALVRDPMTGQVLSFARGGQIDIVTPGQDVDVTFSDGVSSIRRVVRISPR